MKRKLIFNLMAGAIVVVFCALPAIPTFAADTFTEDTCDVSNSQGRYGAEGEGLPLQRALHYASVIQDNIDRCRRNINIKTNIDLYEPVRIDGSIGQSVLTVSGQPASGSRVFLSAGRLNATPPTGYPKCVVWITHANVELKNIEITNVPEGWSGVCVDSNQVLLKNIYVVGGQSGAASCNPGQVSEPVQNEVSDGAVAEGEETTEGETTTAVGEETADGFKFRGTATNNVMTSSCFVSGMSGCAYNFGGTGTSNWNSNRLIPYIPSSLLTNGSNSYDWEDFFGAEAGFFDQLEGTFIETDQSPTTDPESGLIMPVEGDQIAGMVATEAAGLFTNSSPIHICVSYKNSPDDTPAVEGDGKVEIRGFVLRGGEISTDNIASDVKRLQIYTKSGFYGYVGPAGNGQYGMMTYSGSFYASEIPTNGRFLFKVPTGTEPIVLIPETTSGNIGQVSSVVTVQGAVLDPANETPCASIEPGLGSGGGGNGGGGTDGQNVKRMEDETDCLFLRGTTLGQDGHRISQTNQYQYYDTDGDGLTDDQEDSGVRNGDTIVGAFNCQCDAGESCFKSTDTDNDGIPDGSGDMINGGEFSCVEWNSATGFCSDWMDTDGDGTPNASDQDSDDDGRKDFEEDRNDAIATIIGMGNAGIQVGADGEASTGTGFMYEFVRQPGVAAQSDITRPLMISADGVEQRVSQCNLDSSALSVGVEYFYYKIHKSGGVLDQTPVFLRKVENNYPVSLTMEEVTDGYEVGIFACRSKALASGFNFNGTYDVLNNETNAYGTRENGGKDSDGDGVSDGNESFGCAAIRGTDENGCDKPGMKPCNGGSMDNTILFTTMFKSGDTYVTFDEIGNPRLKLGSDDKALILTKTAAEIASACYDSDTDGIPDCVEVPDGHGCKGSQTDLYWNNPDSDNDGHSDGFRAVGGMPQDVCPTSSGEGGMDTFSSDPAHRYSCGNKIQASQWYREIEDKKRVAYFLDRDGDTIRDSEEDENLNGSYDPSTRTSTPTDPITLEVLMTLESDALSLDSDNDGMSDQVERLRPIVSDEGGRYTNPGNRDSDGDTLKDGDEDRNHNGSFDVNIIERGNDLCIGAFDATGAYLLDTDPTNPDTDGDTLNDNVELNGEGFNVGQAFIDMVGNPQVWMSQQGGIPVRSNPRTTDSDGDTLLDNLEYNGDVVRSIESNPCMRDSDGDQVLDNDVRENIGSCRLSVGQLGCDRVTANAVSGVDSDGDRLPDWMEAQLGTDPNVRDSDGDTIEDGEEDRDQDGIFEPLEDESNPALADTDSDGLTDQYEEEYGTEVNVPDTDGDGLLDGQEDANHNGRRDTTETDAKIADTDLDGLCDGSCRGVGEDLNLNGQRDVNENGSWAETDPTNPDSDFDGSSDWDEMTSGGGWNVARNIGAATSGREGCSVAGSAGMAPTSIYYLFGVLLAATRFARRRLKRNCQIGENPLLK